MSEFKESPENIIGDETEKRFALVSKGIPTSEQEYVDPERRYGHNDLYPASTVEVIKIEKGKALIRDATGDFWVPMEKLDL